MRKLTLTCILAGITLTVFPALFPVHSDVNLLSFATKGAESDTIPETESTDEYESLNEKRFDGWTDDDYFSNDYLRAFRRYIDTWLQGKEFLETEADPSELEPYKDRLRGKFIVFDVGEFIAGGLMYKLIPIDDPYLLLTAWIYSVFDDDDNHIDEYLVRMINVYDVGEKMIEDGISKDTLRQCLLEDSEGVRAILW